jgi:hypothetical protein
MSLGLTSVLYGFLCCPSFYVTWSHFRSIWVSMLSEFLCHLVSLPFYMGFFVFLVSMLLGLTSVLYVYLWCTSCYVTWCHFRSVWVSMLSEFLCHLVSLPFYMGFYVVRVSMSLGLYFRSVGVSMLSEFLCNMVSLPLCIGHCVV